MSVKGIVLETGLDLREVVTKGSILHLNEDLNDDYTEETENTNTRALGDIGEPVQSIERLENGMTAVDRDGFVKKRILEEGGGKEIDDSTVSIAYSGYWENEPDPFDIRLLHKPLKLDLQDNGLLPGMLTAVKSMLVGELSVFILNYQVMYGEMGIPPRIKPKAKCVFYIKLVRSITTPKQGSINFSEPNIFQRVSEEAKMLLVSGVQLSKTKNNTAAIQLFRKAVNMLHKVRLADENEEKIQEKLLIKLYTNLAICYNKNKLPLRACTACNEVNRLTNLWNTGKVLFQNAKALRMIGAFESAEKRLSRAMTLYPDSEEMKAEYDLLHKIKETCNQSRLMAEKLTSEVLISQTFKDEVDSLIKKFKENQDLCKLTLPSKLSSAEVDYIREVCVREKVYCNKIQKNFALDKDEEKPGDIQADVFDDMVLF